MRVVLWIGYAVSAVLSVGGAVLVDLSTTGRIMSVRNDELIVSAIGLTYHGAGGAILVVVQAIAVKEKPRNCGASKLVLGSIYQALSRGEERPPLLAICFLLDSNH